jgi:ATP/maltotriose-dependent transcriptional regulator MalT
VTTLGSCAVRERREAPAYESKNACSHPRRHVRAATGQAHPASPPSGACARGLFARLDTCRTTSPLIWIASPPGAGKTALAASWLDARRIGGIWYQVDAGDGDLATFFHYLDRAVPRRHCKRAAAGVHHCAPDGSTGFARLYFRRLFERLKTPAVLVFDLPRASPAAPLHGLLETIVREAPGGITLLVTSRGDPPPQCAGLRANDRLACLTGTRCASLRRNLRYCLAAARTRRSQPASPAHAG